MVKNKKTEANNKAQSFLLDNQPYEEQIRLKNRALTSCAEGNNCRCHPARLSTYICQ